MQVPLEINWRGIDNSPAVEEEVRKRVDKLAQFFDPILSCRVVVEKPQGQHHKGDLFHVSINLKVPDKEIVTNRSPAVDHSHEDIYVCIRDAFDAARRQLQDYARIRRGDVKHHEP